MSDNINDEQRKISVRDPRKDPRERNLYTDISLTQEMLDQYKNALQKASGRSVSLIEGKSNGFYVAQFAMDIPVNISVADIALARDLPSFSQKIDALSKSGISVSNWVGTDKKGKVIVSFDVSDMVEYDLAHGIGAFASNAEKIAPQLKNALGGLEKEIASVMEARALEKVAAAAATKQAEEYGKLLASTTSLPVRISQGYDDSKTGKGPIIDIGEISDERRADITLHRISRVLEEHGLPGRHFDIRGGKGNPILSISAFDISKYDERFGKDAFTKKLQEITPLLKTTLAGVDEEIAAYNAAIAIKTKPAIEGNFDDLEKGIDNRHYKEEPLKIHGADFKLAESVKLGALDFAEEVEQILTKQGIDPKNTKELGYAAGLDGDKSTLTREELASALLAKSMFVPKYGCGGEGLVTTFDGQLFHENFQGTMRDGTLRDPIVQEELARQILGDNFNEKLGTLTPEGDAVFKATVDRSKKTEHNRC